MIIFFGNSPWLNKFCIYTLLIFPLFQIWTSILMEFVNTYKHLHGRKCIKLYITGYNF